MSFSSPNHFPIISYSKLVKPVTLLPGRARLATKPWPTGSATRTNTIGRDVCLPPQGGDRERTTCYDHLCWQPNQFSRVGAHLVEIGTGVSIIDLNVMAGHPSDRLESLTQRLKIKLCIRIVLSYAQQHADASHPLALLCAHRERPRRRAAEQADELAPLHSFRRIRARAARRRLRRSPAYLRITQRLWVAVLEFCSVKHRTLP